MNGNNMHREAAITVESVADILRAHRRAVAQRQAQADRAQEQDFANRLSKMREAFPPGMAEALRLDFDDAERDGLSLVVRGAADVDGVTYPISVTSDYRGAITFRCADVSCNLSMRSHREVLVFVGETLERAARKGAERERDKLQKELDAFNWIMQHLEETDESAADAAQKLDAMRGRLSEEQEAHCRALLDAFIVRKGRKAQAAAEALAQKRALAARLKKMAELHLAHLAQYEQECRAWAERETAALDSGDITVYSIRYGLAGRCASDELPPFEQITVVEPPAAIVERLHAHGVALVTRVWTGGDSERVYVGSFLDAAEQTFPAERVRSTTKGVDYCRKVWAGGFVVNVPWHYGEEVAEQISARRPQEPEQDFLAFVRQHDTELAKRVPYGLYAERALELPLDKLAETIRLG